MTKYMTLCVCVCVCVCVREREYVTKYTCVRERVHDSVCVCVCECCFVRQGCLYISLLPVCEGGGGGIHDTL